ncbi:MAG: uridine kinase [Anaerolineae bacterium]|nr:uridine kinase [Anaerolineae bacterium]
MSDKLTIPQRSSPITIGVAGGSGAGKTTVSRQVLAQIGEDKIAYVPHDNYYKDLRHLPFDERTQVNFDHPDSLDDDLFIADVRRLQRYEPISMPVYDFSTYTRTDDVTVVQPHRVILVEGILIYADQRLRDLFDVRIFVDTDDDVRFIRRLQRDITARGRTTESVIHQWLETVRPMHQQFVEPSRRHAHVIIPEGGMNEIAIEMVIARIQARRSQQH